MNKKRKSIDLGRDRDASVSLSLSDIGGGKPIPPKPTNFVFVMFCSVFGLLCTKKSGIQSQKKTKKILKNN